MCQRIGARRVPILRWRHDNNRFRNGLLPVVLAMEQVQHIAALTEGRGADGRITVDLSSNTVFLDNGMRFAFEVPATLRQMLLLGIDEIDQTLSRKSEIDSFRARDKARRPWIYLEPAAMGTSTEPKATKAG